MVQLPEDIVLMLHQVLHLRRDGLFFDDLHSHYFPRLHALAQSHSRKRALANLLIKIDSELFFFRDLLQGDRGGCRSGSG